MLNLFLAIILFNAIHTTTLFSMDFDKETELPHNTLPINQTSASKNILEDIDKKVNAAIPQGIFFAKSPEELTEKEYLTMAKIVQTNCPQMNNSFIIELMQKNEYFAATIKYFISLTRKSIDSVTSSTLDIVSDPNKQQPTPALNQLKPVLKKYVMNYAYSEINSKYTMIFSGHTQSLYRLSINHPSYRAASTDRCGECKIWSLQTGKELYTFPEKNYFLVKFNQDGSLLATSTQSHDNIIHIWRITDSDPILKYKINPVSSIQKLIFSGNHLNIIDISNKMIPYQLKKNGTIIQLNAIHLGYKANIDDRDCENCTFNENSWTFTKNLTFLYFCKKAIINTKIPSALTNINKDTRYKTFTPYEKDIVKEMAKTIRGIEI